MKGDRILKRLGFRVLSSIGEGAYGKVKLAKSKRYPNPVAIKIMDCRKEDYNFTFKLLPRELSILRTVKHPHTVKVHEILQHSGHVFIVMEPAAMNLYHKVQQDHHIPTSQAKEWFSQLLSAVIYLHQQDIVHRDLKCENILVTADGQLKLTDFGSGCFSRGFPELCKSCCGTLYYSAPERLMRKPYDAKKADVWSLGVILYIMVTGILPSNRDFWNSIPHKEPGVVHFPSWISLEGSCRDIISSMLEFDPCDRPSAETVAQHPWLKSARRERVTGRFTVVTVDEDGGGSSDHGSSSTAGTSVTYPGEAVEEEEEHSSVSCGLFSAAKIAVKTKIVETIVRASRNFRRWMRELVKGRHQAAKIYPI